MENVGAVMVVGAGIGGSQAALDLADSGYKVYLIESSTSIGGVMAQLDKTFPTNDCAMCIVSPKLVETGRHQNIDLSINCKIEGVSGEAGNFTVKILKRSLFINPDKCTGCGVCGRECPVEAIDIFNEGLAKYSATSVKYPQAVPLVYAINKEYCIGCGICQGVCKAKAVEYDRTDEEVEIKVGAIVLAPGFDEYIPPEANLYGYGKYSNVVTSIEFERILSASGPYTGKVLRPSDGDIPEKVAFLQCIGSRDYTGNGKPYCSSVCCMYTAKEAVIAHEHMHQIKPTIFSMDVRAYGKDFDKYIIRAQEEYGVQYIRSRISSITEVPETKNLRISYENEEGKVVEEDYHMVVLAVGLNPPNDTKYLAEKFGIELNEHNFAKTDLFNPVQTTVPGIFACGAFTSPKDIPDTVTQASAAAGCVNQLLYERKGTLITEKTLPPEIFVNGQPPRIGVFICHCGINIGGFVDVPEVTKYAGTLPNVVLSDRNLYTCSADTQTIIKEKVEEF
ncbi:MAG: FAD-dependent oxidoreductase, partial [Promethearchaeota archaeon]